MELRYSFIIPVYNRPEEVDELLFSLSNQITDIDFEVVIVEDGSITPCEHIVNKYNMLDIKYFRKSNSGPGDSRNYGMSKASGNYFIILDSDCVVPEHYLSCVNASLKETFYDAYGGPDAAHASFTIIQKSINYSMTSYLTTGGIRGKGEKLDKFYPRSFNMGISSEVFKRTKGFSKMRFGEDIDMSIRILKEGFKTGLLKDAFVYHKRRTNLSSFYKQVYNSGIARINLYKLHPSSLKLVHFFPSLFVLGFVVMLVFCLFINKLFVLPILFYLVLILFDSSFRNKSFVIGLVSILVVCIQFLAYGLGFIIALVKRVLIGQKEFKAFTKTFYE